MYKYLIQLVLVIVHFTGLNAQNTVQVKSTKPLSIGETVTLYSKILDEERILNIYLPHGYSPDSAKVYPVLYLLDGSMHQDIIHISGQVQYASFSWINRMPETIVVGIANVDRIRDFSFPTQSKKQKENFPTSGGSEKFIQFMEKEVMPFVEQNYKTDTIKTLLGQSAGGLLASEVLVKMPDLFDNYIIISPSLWWSGQGLLDLTPKAFTTKKSISIAVGKEGEVMEETAKKLYEKLKAQKTENTRLFFTYFEDEDHASIMHDAVYDALGKVFKKEDTKNE